MTDLKIVMDAIERIESGEALTEEHYAAIKPMFSIVKDQLKPKGRISFKHITGGYLIQSVFFPELDGLEYIQRLLQQGSVRSIVLWSRDSLGKSGVLYRQLEPGLADDDESIFEDTPHQSNPYQASEPQEIFSVGMAQKMLVRIDELTAETATPERDRKVRFLEGELRRHRYKRDIKSFEDEAEKARKAVERAIRRAIAKLIETQETQDIGLHLQETIVTGEICRYIGDLKWKF